MGKLSCTKKKEEQPKGLEFWAHRDGSIAVLQVEDNSNLVEEDISQLRLGGGTYDDELTVT